MIVLSVICYGIAYLPIFASLTLVNIPSLILGTLHAWMFTGIEIYKAFQCVYVIPPVSKKMQCALSKCYRLQKYSVWRKLSSYLNTCLLNVTKVYMQNSNFWWCFYVVTLRFGLFCGCRGFCHKTESDLFLFLLGIHSDRNIQRLAKAGSPVFPECVPAYSSWYCHT